MVAAVSQFPDRISNGTGGSAMMKLLSNPLSPYGRKVKITAKMKCVADQIQIENTDTNVPSNPALEKENPLAKIPVLILDDGAQLYDSHVICEYLDSLKPSPRLFPSAGAERFNTLTLGALGDGILDAALLLVYEKRFRPEDKWVQSWMDRQQAKIDGALDRLEKNPPDWGAHPDYGHLTIACALGYLDFRHAGIWRPTHPRLVAWLDRFAAAVPAFAETKPA
jgi:glutathione S-transferase